MSDWDDECLRWVIEMLCYYQLYFLNLHETFNDGLYCVDPRRWKSIPISKVHVLEKKSEIEYRRGLWLLVSTLAVPILATGEHEEQRDSLGGGDRDAAERAGLHLQVGDGGRRSTPHSDSDRVDSRHGRRRAQQTLHQLRQRRAPGFRQPLSPSEIRYLSFCPVLYALLFFLSL